MENIETFDVVVVGGGPAGATAAEVLARRGRSVLLLDRSGRIKPCGGAIPPRLIADFAIPDNLLVARATSARMISPSDCQVDMPIENGFVGMVDREAFDEWLRERARTAGAVRRAGSFTELTRDAHGAAVVGYRSKRAAKDGDAEHVRARAVIGADGAKSAVGRQCVKGADRIPRRLVAECAERGGVQDVAHRRLDVAAQIDRRPAALQLDDEATFRRAMNQGVEPDRRAADLTPDRQGNFVQRIDQFGSQPRGEVARQDA